MRLDGERHCNMSTGAPQIISASPLRPSCQISWVYVEGLIYSNSLAIWLSFLDIVMMGGASLACQVFQNRAKTASRRRPQGGLGLAGVGGKGVSD